MCSRKVSAQIAVSLGGGVQLPIFSTIARVSSLPHRHLSENGDQARTVGVRPQGRQGRTHSAAGVSREGGGTNTHELGLLYRPWPSPLLRSLVPRVSQ